MSPPITYLSLDLSMNSTGYAVFKGDILTDSGIIVPEKYPRMSLDRYPKKSIKLMRSCVSQIQHLIYTNNPDVIIIEEINSNGRKNIVSLKILAGLCFLIFNTWSDEMLDKVRFIKTSEWRAALGIKKGIGWKESTIDYINKIYNRKYTIDDNDITDAIALVLAVLKLDKKK